MTPLNLWPFLDIFFYRDNMKMETVASLVTCQSFYLSLNSQRRSSQHCHWKKKKNLYTADIYSLTDKYFDCGYQPQSMDIHRKLYSWNWWKHINTENKKLLLLDLYTGIYIYLLEWRLRALRGIFFNIFKRFVQGIRWIWQPRKKIFLKSIYKLCHCKSLM